ncbi:rhomboid family intramembrane serine protease [Verrucomicrobium sp. BvORR106]|uniref:rhomboid family intramembrane serine protease n=1 Tax=Verrucomicrobium sp. BvORR106 TaxID=1403819 RepID=UPI000691197E|nr:rhomboid family intramembrane serine protease [Verrucomicrobium sp. BvORR106]
MRPVLTSRSLPTIPGAGLALLIVAGTLALGLYPATTEAWQWQRGTGGVLPQPGHWQWLTSHITHWSWGHLIWDLVAFIILSFVCLRILPSRYPLALALAAALIPLEVRLLEPQFTSYRGLSGLDSALFGLVVAALWRTKAPLPRLLAALGTCGLVGKTGFELVTGTTLFAPAEPGLYLPVPSAHLTGFVAGLLAGLPMGWALTRPPAPCAPGSRNRFHLPAWPR